MKWCWRCKRELPLSEYSRDASRPDGLNHSCRHCNKERQREFHRKNPRKKFEYKLRAYFKLELGDYEALLERQSWCCAACGDDFGEKPPHVDHDRRCCAGDRSCGRCVRGILCHWCNTAAGLVKDDPAVARRLASYLERTAVAQLSSE